MADKQVLEAVERAQAILARYVEPGEGDCERTINDLLDVLAALFELLDRGDDLVAVEAVAELRRLLGSRSSPLEFSAEECG